MDRAIRDLEIAPIKHRRARGAWRARRRPDTRHLAFLPRLRRGDVALRALIKHRRARGAWRARRRPDKRRLVFLPRLRRGDVALRAPTMMAFAAVLLATLLLVGPVRAADVVVVMDDLGYSLALAERVMALPAPVTLALLPFAPATGRIAGRALTTGHEMILHQPMEPLDVSQVRPAPGTLTVDMPAELFEARIDAALAAVPGIVGVNNHTGSRLTQDTAAMRRLMSLLARRDLMFLDSRTTPATVAYSMAREAHIPALKRDVFLDHVPALSAIDAEFRRAIAIAERQGYAVIIAHPYDVTLEFLARRLEDLPVGVSVVSLRQLADRDRPATLARQQSPAFPHRSLGH